MGRRNVRRQTRALCRFVFVLALATAWAMAATAAEKKITHPELSEQEQLVACSECHQEATPELYTEWYESLHGLAMVKCYQCHGTFETFRVTPTRQDCAACHENMLAKCPQDKPCWQCHVPHDFKVRK